MELLLPPSARLVSKDVDRLRLARYYIELELLHALPLPPNQFTKALGAAIKRLPELEVWRLLEALSYTYRMNGIFGTITNQAFDWHEIEVAIADIILTPMNPPVDKLIFSEAISANPQHLADYLRSYFTRHPHDDPEGLAEFRPKGHDILHSILFVTIDRKGRIAMLDGSHRLIAFAMLGDRTVRAFAAVRNGKPTKRMAGDSIFETLKTLYHSAQTTDEQAAVLAVTRMLLKRSSDGKKAIKTYWIEHARSEKVEQAALQLLAKRAKSQPKQRGTTPVTDKPRPVDHAPAPTR